MLANALYQIFCITTVEKRCYFFLIYIDVFSVTANWKNCHHVLIKCKMPCKSDIED